MEGDPVEGDPAVAGSPPMDEASADEVLEEPGHDPPGEGLGEEPPVEDSEVDAGPVKEGLAGDSPVEEELPAGETGKDDELVVAGDQEVSGSDTGTAAMEGSPAPGGPSPPSGRRAPKASSRSGSRDESLTGSVKHAGQCAALR
ncbi:hypothetical protein Ade02nite_50420 [Paractinoplanes deccanensis]|uniref:Uncharacterized protein n=1 Tax=Paractinoplanes deccanensis TaxID=113561 RepID=A0ABQ3Y8S7_9ACTN|nr:hypothetical protein [Actinoplanes deccanensis]GID76401.1 hypothetical protein Ade02nite_50420 [Actinoplanes deccanensis]